MTTSRTEERGARPRRDETIVGNPVAGRPFALAPRRSEGPVAPDTLKHVAATGAWRVGWQTAVDVEIAGVRVDVLCTKGAGRVALFVRPEAPAAAEAARLASALDAAGLRSAWFSGRGLVVPPFARPTPLFRLAVPPTGDAVAVLPDSKAVFPLASAVEALFTSRLQYREHAALAGPWWVSVAAVRLRCWRCASPYGAFRPRAVRADVHGRLIEAPETWAFALVERALDAVLLRDARGERVAAARVRAGVLSCPACDAAIGPATLDELVAVAPPLERALVALEAPAGTAPCAHWCAADASSAGACCPEGPVDPGAAWIAAARPRLLSAPPGVAAVLGSGASPRS